MKARRLPASPIVATAMLLTSSLLAQTATPDIVIDLEPAKVSGRGIGWSPKGATVALTRSGDELVGTFRLGPDKAPAIGVALRKGVDSDAFDHLALDGNRDGAFANDEVLATTPRDRRGKLWSSFTGSVDVPVTAPDGTQRLLKYPLALWFVFDPSEPDAAPALRWSRRGWMEGNAKAAGETICVAMAELVMDGVYDQRDRWAIAATPVEARDRNAFRGLDDHNWRGESAYRVVKVHPSGLRVTVRAFDPGMTRAAEKAARDRYAADKRAPRAKAPVAFGHDFAVAEAAAKAGKKRLFVDFETTWCGPCKQMDAMVYTAQAVVDAAANVVAVKVDGDEHKDLVKRFAVAAYPTMILLASDGSEIRRAVGYQSVAKMRAFLRE